MQAYRYRPCRSNEPVNIIEEVHNFGIQDRCRVDAVRKRMEVEVLRTHWGCIITSVGPVAVAADLRRRFDCSNSDLIRAAAAQSMAVFEEASARPIDCNRFWQETKDRV